MMQNSTTTTISGIGVGGGSSASTSSRQEQQFVQDLVQFYRTRGVNNAHAKQFVVRLNGKVVNLSELYSLILECGGSFKVNQINLWDEIYCRLFKTTSVGANFAVALRQVYNRYLLQYEKNCSGQSLNSADYQQWNEEEDEENLFSNTNLHSSALAAQVHASRADLNNVLDGSSGQVHNDSKLYCSLLSGLPNELNFAFNVATILSNCNRFDWAADYKFVNVLLESMKSYCCICDQFEEDVAFGRRRPDDYHNNPHDDEFLHFQRLITSSISTLERGRSSGRRKEDGNSARNNATTTTATTTPTLNGHCTEETTSPADISITSTNSSSLSSSSSASSSSSSSAVSFRPPKRKAAIEFTDRRCNCYRQFWSRMCLDEEVLARVLLDDHDDDDYCCSLDLGRLGGGSGGGGGSRSAAAALSSPTAFADIPAPLMKKIEQRIELIGGIILNISVTYEQQQQQQKEGGGGGGGEPNRVAMLPLLKLLLLMVRSTSPSYLALALDILANIAPALSCYTPGKLQQPLYAYLLDGTLRSVVELATTSAHLHHTTKSLEILARYIAACGGGAGGGSGVVGGGGGGGGAEANAFLETYFENVKLCERITQLLTCQYDIALLLALLEFCLTLSETRPFLLVQSDGKILIKLLVNLLNCEASTYFTTGAFRKVKVIDDRPRSEQQPQQLLQQQQPSAQQTAVLPGNVIPQNGGNVLMNRQPTMATTMVTTTTGTASTTINHTNQHHPHHQQQQVVIVNRGPLPNSTQAAPNPAPATATPTIGSVAVQNQTVVAAVNQHILDNESFAISWLRSTYEDAPGSSFKVGDIYAEYLKHCCRNARKNVIATQSFGYLIKRCFPAVNLNNSLNVQAVGGGGGNQNTGTIIEGLAVKGALVAPGGPGAAGATATSIIGGTVVSQHPQLMSPILKAHLSTPPKSSCLAAAGQAPGSPQQTLEQPTTPTTPTAPPASAAPNSSTSTLIKSLLANKLRNNQNTTLVTTPPPPLAGAPSGSVKLQPIGTSLGGSQPLIIANNNSNSSGSSSATIESKADLKPQNAQPQQQQVVFATSNSIAAPTTTFANSYIVQQQQPNSQQQQLQQQQPGQPQPGQQILLVRTVLASQPGQQSPVRLLLPASMVGGGAGGGQRLVVPAGATTNGQLVMAPQASVVVQPQANTAAAASQPKAVPTASAVNSSSSSSSTIANSSPLLNVLLDKGKLPDFPSAASASSTTSAANSSSTSNTSSSSSTTTTTTASAVVVPSQTSTVSSSVAVAAGQPKMYVLTTKPGPAMTAATNASTEPSAANNNNNNSVVDGRQPNSSTPQLNNNNSSSSAPPLVNGDVGGGSCGQKQQQQLANSNSAIKHALESSSSNPKAEDDEAETEDEKEEGPPSAKRLKTAAAAAAQAEQNDESGETAKGTPTTGSAVQVATNHGFAEAKVVVANGTMAKSGGETAVPAVTPPPPPPTVVTNGPIPVDQSTTTPNVKSAVPVEKQSATTGNAETLTTTAPAAAAQQPPSAVAPPAPATSAPPAAAATPATPKTQAQAPPPPAAAAAAPTPPKVEAPLDFECQWGDCRRKFARPSEVFYHVHCEHIMTAAFPAVSSCQWGGPEGKGPGCLSKRPKLSLLTHLQDFHCNANNLKQELLRRRQLQVMGTTNILLAAPPAHPGYAQNAAMLAIRRHAANFAQDTGASTGPPPSPLTVSIRLTSALILRNLAQRSHLVKKSLELFEPQLCEISIAEGREEARTIAQCLAVIADQGR